MLNLIQHLAGDVEILNRVQDDTKGDIESGRSDLRPGNRFMRLLFAALALLLTAAPSFAQTPDR
ncbi:MAG: hypothetical protein AAFU38_09400, partial [Bacteroidota bacterium]